MQHFCCSQRSSYVALDWFCLRWLVYNDRQSEWTTASRDSSAWEQMKADSDVRWEMRAWAGQQPSWGPGAMRPKALRGSWAQTFTSAAPRQTPEDRNKHSPGNHQRLADQTKQWKTQRQNKQNTQQRQKCSRQNPHELPYSDANYNSSIQTTRPFQHLTRLDSWFPYSSWEFQPTKYSLIVKIIIIIIIIDF